MKEKIVSAEEVAAMGRGLTHEIHLLYTLSLSLDAMIFDIERRMRKYGEGYHFERERKKRFNDYLDLLRKCKTQYEQFILPTIQNSSSDAKFRDFEDTRVFSQELLRLILAYYEQCPSQENHEKVFDFLCSLEGGRGVFTSEDINIFNLGCKQKED